MVGNSGKTQPVPGFGGFVSATGTKPSRKSTIDYFVPIGQPFTEYSVIAELLNRSEEATMAVGQEYSSGKPQISIRSMWLRQVNFIQA